MIFISEKNTGVFAIGRLQICPAACGFLAVMPAWNRQMSVTALYLADAG